MKRIRSWEEFDKAPQPPYSDVAAWSVAAAIVYALWWFIAAWHVGWWVHLRIDRSTPLDRQFE